MNGFELNHDEQDNGDKILINVGGIKFETYVTTLQNIADTRLTWLTENVDADILRSKEFFFDRHPGAFVHILNYYRTGKLHTPTDICGPLFEEELQFWGIDEKQMEPCCWESFTKHREAEENLRSFVGPGFEDLNGMDDRKTSVLSGDDYLGEKRFLCLSLNFSKIWKVLDEPHSSKYARRFSLLSCLMIIVSISVYCLHTMPSLQENAIWHNISKGIHMTSLTFFTLELFLRTLTTPNKILFIRNYQNWIDFLSVVPSYLLLIFPENAWIQHLVIIRLLRVFKFFKLSYGLQVLLHTLKGSLHELTLLLLILLIPVVIFSSLVYAFEFGLYKENPKFNSIPRSFWWCLITMATVGYGDLVPVTWAGQIIGSVCAVSGLLILALPISVIGSNFTLYYAHVRARLKLPKKNRTLLQGNLRGLLRHPLSLSSRDRDRKTLRRNANNAIRRKTTPSSPESMRLQLKRREAFDQISQTTIETDSPRNDNQYLVKRAKSQSIDMWSNVELKTTDSSEHLESKSPTRTLKDDEIYQNNVLSIAKSISNDSFLDIGLVTSPLERKRREMLPESIDISHDISKQSRRQSRRKCRNSPGSPDNQYSSLRNISKLMSRNKKTSESIARRNMNISRNNRRGALTLFDKSLTSEESDCEYLLPSPSFSEGAFPTSSVNSLNQNVTNSKNHNDSNNNNDNNNSTCNNGTDYKVNSSNQVRDSIASTDSNNLKINLEKLEGDEKRSEDTDKTLVNNSAVEQLEMQLHFNGERKSNLEIPSILKASTKNNLDVSLEKDRRISMKHLKLDELSLPKNSLRPPPLKRSLSARAGKFDISSSSPVKNKISQSMSQITVHTERFNGEAFFKNLNQHSYMRSFTKIDYGGNIFLGKDSNAYYKNTNKGKIGCRTGANDVETISENYARSFSKESGV